MTTDTPLPGDDAVDLLQLATRVRRAHLTRTEWNAVIDSLNALNSTLPAGSNREVLRAAGVFNDLMPVRVRTQPGTLPVESLPDDVVHLVHELDVAVRERFAGTVGDGRSDDR